MMGCNRSAGCSLVLGTDVMSASIPGEGKGNAGKYEVCIPKYPPEYAKLMQDLPRYTCENQTQSPGRSIW